MDIVLQVRVKWQLDQLHFDDLILTRYCVPETNQLSNQIPKRKRIQLEHKREREEDLPNLVFQLRENRSIPNVRISA